MYLPALDLMLPGAREAAVAEVYVNAWVRSIEPMGRVRLVGNLLVSEVCFEFLEEGGEHFYGKNWKSL